VVPASRDLPAHPLGMSNTYQSHIIEDHPEK
jgi:hypothetical protein